MNFLSYFDSINTSFLLYFLIALTMGISRLVFIVINPIHSILNLIGVFFLGNCLLFFISIEYYARLFLIVYVGAIVVLFLFIIIRLELKIINTVQLYNDYFRYISIGFFILYFMQMVSFETFDLRFFFSSNSIGLFTEANTSVNTSTFLYQMDQLNELGQLLYTEYKLSVILASLLLFIVIVGVLILTLYTPTKFYYKSNHIVIKRQDTQKQIRNNN